MFWAVFWIVSLARGCGCEGGEWVQAGAREQKEQVEEESTLQVDGRGSSAGESQLMGLMARLVAANWKKAQELAFEGFISLVHLMCRVLIPGAGAGRGQRASRHSSLFSFVVNQPQVAGLLTQMLDPDLIDHILNESRQKLNHFPRDSVDCIQVLTCKTKPFVGGMQRALRFFMDRQNAGLSTGAGREGACSERGTCPRNEAEAAWEAAALVDRMYFFMPTLGEVVEHGDRCDQLFPDCLY